MKSNGSAVVESISMNCVNVISIPGRDVSSGSVVKVGILVNSSVKLSVNIEVVKLSVNTSSVTPIVNISSVTV